MTSQEADLGTGPRRYHLLELVGRGAFGEVYLAELESGGFRRKVALKVLTIDAQQRRSARLRMQEEARILGRLAHRNIVMAIDFVRVGQRAAIVMDFVPGADLDHVLAALDVNQERLPPRVAFEIVTAVADALHAAFVAGAEDGHPLGIVHRDIKPSNLRLSPDGEVKVLDFGIAFAPGGRAVAGNPIMGTEVYMAPERFLGAGDHPSIDVYSLGITLIELLTASTLGPPVAEAGEHEARVSIALEAVRRALVGVGQDLEWQILELVGACVAFDPRQRPTAEVLALQFEQIAAALPGEQLRTFCRRFVAKVDELMGTRPVPVTGVWTEEGGTGVHPPADSLPPASENGYTGPRYTGSTPLPSAAEGPPRWLVLAGFIALLGVAAMGAAVAILWPILTGAPEPTSSALTAAPTLPVTPPTPMVAPVPAPDVEAEAPAPSPVRRAAPRAAPAPVAPVAPDMDVLTSRVVEPDPSPRIEKAQFSARDASRIEVTCGDRSASGTSSVRLTDFPAGKCTMIVDYLGMAIRGDVTLDQVGQVRCEVVGEKLSCSTP